MIEVCQMLSEPEHERRMCDLINLGSLALQFPALSGNPLDDVEQLNSTSPLDALSSISKLIRVSDTSLPDDHFTMIHKRCCVGRSLLVEANEIIDSVDGIELEAEASKAPPPQPTQAVSEFLERTNERLRSPHFEVVMRLTATPTTTNFWQDVAVPSEARSDIGFAWCPRLICIYCPEFEYSLFQHRHLENEQHTTEALKRHMGNDAHKENYRRFSEERHRDRTRSRAATAPRSHDTPQESPL